MLGFSLVACGGAAQPQAEEAAQPAPQQVEQIAAEAKEAAEEVAQQPAEAVTELQADLSGIKTYLLDKAGALKQATAQLKEVSDQYYELAKGANFDYAKLWQDKPAEVTKVIEDARTAWMAASPLYEQMEGIVAGTPSLAQYDVDMDAGAAASEDPEGAVSFDLTLPNGQVLPKPGNLFGVTESTLWGTFADYKVKNVQADFNGDGKTEFGESLPDANVLKGGADLLASKATDLEADAQKWEPSESDAFTALVVMVPTMSEYFNSWKNSRYIAGDASTQRDFVAISRLADIQDILGSLQVTYKGVSPMVKAVDPDQDTQIEQGLVDLKAFVGDVHSQEKGGKHFSAEEADLLGAEAQDRASAITGKIAQVAGQLDVEIQE
ncbi:MAG: EfeM/EfeO family lipoprotein [Chloroflexi bacterium]|nr:EfeM/EfeO family lipoprotein [Chloroflexota bacterium]